LGSGSGSVLQKNPGSGFGSGSVPNTDFTFEATFAHEIGATEFQVYHKKLANFT
jgi:hypothetical protein